MYRDNKHDEPGNQHRSHPQSNDCQKGSIRNCHLDGNAAGIQREPQCQPGQSGTAGDAQRNGRKHQDQRFRQQKQSHLGLCDSDAPQNRKAVDLTGHPHDIDTQHSDHGHCRNDVHIKSVIVLGCRIREGGSIYAHPNISEITGAGG